MHYNLYSGIQTPFSLHTNACSHLWRSKQLNGSLSVHRVKIASATTKTDVWRHSHSNYVNVLPLSSDLGRESVHGCWSVFILFVTLTDSRWIKSWKLWQIIRHRMHQGKYTIETQSTTKIGSWWVGLKLNREKPWSLASKVAVLMEAMSASQWYITNLKPKLANGSLFLQETKKHIGMKSFPLNQLKKQHKKWM